MTVFSVHHDLKTILKSRPHPLKDIVHLLKTETKTNEKVFLSQLQQRNKRETNNIKRSGGNLKEFALSKVGKVLRFNKILE